jgi:hypothetical protein
LQVNSFAIGNFIDESRAIPMAILQTTMLIVDVASYMVLSKSMGEICSP